MSNDPHRMQLDDVLGALMVTALMILLMAL